MASDPKVQEKFGIKPAQTYQRLISHAHWTDKSLEDVGPNNQLVVIHLAGLAHQMQGATPADMHTANTQFAVQVARQAIAAGCKTFVLVSTAKVMGDRTHKPADEQDDTQPSDVYSKSKLAAETALLALFKHTPCKLIIVRPPLVYGPQAKANFESLMQWCAKGLLLPFGAVTKPRSMIYIDNLCDALLWCGFNDAAQAPVYFVKDAQDLSIKDWIIQIRHGLKLPARLVWVPISLLKVLAVLIKKTDAIEKVVSPFQISDQRILSDGWIAPTTVQKAIATTCAVWVGK